jgi:orotate phosphoribosyltransferase
MRDYQRDFLEVVLNNEILKFRQEGFVLNSGRLSPYFFNTGLFNSEKLLSQLSTAYANAILDPNNEFAFDVLFGPAYKGIPLAVATCQTLAHLGSNVEYAFNRKEIKGHGEGGSIVGASLSGKRVVIIDDVITSGRAIREAIEIIEREGGILTGIIVALDRQEQTLESTLSAIESLKREIKIDVRTIITLENIIEFTKNTLGAEYVQQLEAYQERYGVKV